MLGKLRFVVTEKSKLHLSKQLFGEQSFETESSFVLVEKAKLKMNRHHLY
jgi:hypothetical protein